MTQSFDVLIVGGGVVGLSAALAMAIRHYRVAVIDAGDLKIEDETNDRRVYAINHSSKQLLQQLGVWPFLEDNGISFYRKMHVWDEVSGAAIDFDSRDVVLPDLGAMIKESTLKQALLRQINLQNNIQLFPFHTVEKVEYADDSIRVYAKDRCWIGQLLMVADGANSPLREKLQVKLTSWSYHHHALVATVQTELSHQQTAYQVFRPEGPLALLPLKNEKQCAMVWSIAPSKANDLMVLADREFNERLQSVFGCRLGQLNAISSRHQFPLHMRHAKEYVGRRWLLLGDAAHTIHPLAGLGLNVGLADVKSWMAHIDANPLCAFSKKTLGAYQRERKSAVWQKILLMEGLKRMFENSSYPVVLLRGLGLGWCNKSALIRSFFILSAS